MDKKLQQKQFAFEVVKRLRDAGFEALWAGGCVRDYLLEKTPQDYDIATNARPDEVRVVFGHHRTLAIGASFGGALGVTASSGPGIALKGEALGLAVMLEVPLVCINVQRGGPSTGLPTKTEQADLNQALYGRNGEAPMVVMAAASSITF